MDELKIGNRYYSLTVIKINHEDPRGKSWLCKCDCGKEVVLGTHQLLGSSTRRSHRSCGCQKKNRKGATMTNYRLYGVWYEMNKRCYDPKADNYEIYGAKGITVTAEWREDFNIFLDWALANGYKDDLNINRLDPNKPYEPSNCRWADKFVQSQNRGMLKNNKTGVTGVSYSEKNGYRAYITRYKKRKYLGSFKTLGEAAKAREEAEKRFKETGSLD